VSEIGTMGTRMPAMRKKEKKKKNEKEIAHAL
jgi:hypothetical protein